jgi:uncharacterized HAD superfamily protein
MELDAQAALPKEEFDLYETRAERIAVLEEKVKVAEDVATTIRKLAEDKQLTVIVSIKAQSPLLGGGDRS